MASVKQSWIKKYGEEEGLRRYNELKKKYRSANSSNPPIGKNCKKYWTDLGYSDDDAAKLVSDEQRKRSPLCKEYYINKGITDQVEIDKQIVNAMKRRSRRCVEYYLTQGYTFDESVQKVSEYQALLSSKSSKFTGHKHSDLSKQKISDSLLIYWDDNVDRKEINSNFCRERNLRAIELYGKDVWLRKNFGSKNKSIGCISKLERNVQQYLIDFNSSLNYKFNKLVPGTSYVADIMINDFLIVEVNGDYWHANPNKYKKDERIKYPGGEAIAEDQWNKDALRINTFTALGYTVFVVWENDWLKNTNKIKQELNKFINENINSITTTIDNNGDVV